MKNSKNLIALVISVFASLNLMGQNDLAFYHMGELTPQSSIFNPVFFPDAKVYVSLPVLSGVNMNFNNSFTYNDIFESVSGSDSVQFAPDRLLGNMKGGDRLSFNSAISLMQIGVQVGQFGAIQFFANERIKASMFYPKEMLTYILSGNGDFLDEEVFEKNLRIKGTYYREFGIGYSRELTVLGNKQLRAGLRLKYLQGFAQAEVDKNAYVSFYTDPSSYNVTISTNQPVFSTAGFDSMDESGYFMSNGNKGFGIDIGADMQITPKLNVALAINDIGSINWKEGVKQYELMESEATFGGLDLRDLDNAGDVLSDTLEQLFDYNEIIDGSYKSKLNTRIIMSGIYKVTPKGSVTGTIMTRNDLGKMSFTFGAGYTHQIGRILTLSSTLSKKPRQGFAFGGGFGARLGFLQLYTSVDNIIGFTDIRKMQNVNVRFGMNFLFGRRSESKPKEETAKAIKTKSEKEKISPFPDEYGLDHLMEIE